jgi:hypothetical protein
MTQAEGEMARGIAYREREEEEGREAKLSVMEMAMEF